MKKSLLLLISFYIFIVLNPPKAYAAKLSLGVYPPLMEINAAPGAAIKETITIKNFGDSPITVDITHRRIISSERKNGEVSFPQETTADKNFFTESVKIEDGNVQVNQVLLAPQEKKQLVLVVTLPTNASSQDNYFCILFITKANKNSKSNASFISQGIGTNILLSVRKQKQEDNGYIKQFSTPTFHNTNSIPFTLEVGNQSPHYIPAAGYIIIKNILFKSKDIIPISPSTILEEDSRFLTDFIDQSESTIVWRPNTLLFGIYEAEAFIHFGNNPIVFHKKIYFYSYSLPSLILVCSVFIFIGIIIFRIYKKRTK